MTKAIKRFGLGIGATAIAVIMAGAGYQNLSAQGPGPGGPGVARFGGPGMGRGGPGMAGLPGFMLGRLDLTSDQKDRVRQIMGSHRDEQRALADRARQAHQALNDAITSPTFDESAIRARANDVSAVDADMAVAQARIYGEVYQILTADQQEKLKQLQADRKARADKMREERGQRQGGRGR